MQHHNLPEKGLTGAGGSEATAPRPRTRIPSEIPPPPDAGLSHIPVAPGRAQPGSGGGRGGGGGGSRGRHKNGPTYPENDIEAEDEIFDATTDFRPLVVLSGHPLRS